MKQFKCAVSFMMVLALVLVFIGCAKPPDAEKSAAKVSMDSATAAGADKYAAADFKAAKTLWDGAEGQMTAKKYDEAKKGYVEAKAAFEKASGAVAAGKKALADEANALIAGLEEGWKNLETTAKSAAKKMKDKKDAWEADGKTFADGLKATKDMIATDPIGAKAKAGDLKALIAKWDAAFKELTSAPAKPEKAKKAEKKEKK
jgi:hypothetical protein